MSSHRTTTRPDPHGPAPDLIRRHLDDLIASPHFRNSKRSQLLLKYVVEAYLEGSLDQVKERIIGSIAFHRDPDYDTNQDSVVRTTAAEVRKRLAQYYQDPGHENEIRLSLPQGSYLPEFRQPPLPTMPAPAVEAVRPPRAHWWWAGGLAIVALAAAAYVIPAARVSDLDRFWMPLLDDPAEVVICIEQPLRIYRFTGPRMDDLNQTMVGSPAVPPAAPEIRENSPVQLSELTPTGEQYFTYGDLMASVRLGEMLSRRHKPFQLLGDRLTSYNDLRGHPAILLGQFNNKWTNGLTSGLRYYLEKNSAARSYEVRDRQNGDKVIASLPRLNRAGDYAIVSRIVDLATEKTVVAVSATTFLGTLAAGDFLTHEAYMREAFHSAPATWWKKDVQVVIRSRMIGGIPGPPKMVALHFW